MNQANCILKLKSFLICMLFIWVVPCHANDTRDFSNAKVVVGKNLSRQERAAADLLIEEIGKRTLLRLDLTEQWPTSATPAIVIGTVSSLAQRGGDLGRHLQPSAVNMKPEGFSIKLLKGEKNVPTILIAGNDARGMLFGVGYFLRKVIMKKQQLLVPASIVTETSPVVGLRGHQLGYRPKTNSYDGLNAEQWEQYIRDLVVFGTNAIELLPPHTDDAPDSPMFPIPQMDMMVLMNDMLDKYGLDAWIWYPLMFGDYTKIENVNKGIAECTEVFKKLKKVDAVFVPGGDPGHTPPKILFRYLEKQAGVLRQFHPKAEMWVSPQGFTGEWMNEFFELLKQDNAWLTGIVYGPQISMDINSLRKLIPAKYPLRRYPDLSHSLDAQYPVPNWDFAFAATQHREGINPRPLDQATIFRSTPTDGNRGFIAYSEGLHDDVNKIVWSGLGWNPNEDVRVIMEDYSRYFIGHQYTTDFAQGLLNLEQNWDGSLLSNGLVNVHHGIFQTMEANASPQVRLNWRFQMALYRSYYDAYNRSRLIYETQLEEQATEWLRKAPAIGTMAAMEKAREVLLNARIHPVAVDLKQRVFELAEGLFQSVRMQLSVGKYFAIAVRRGANLDLIDYPLNNQYWLEEQFTRIAKIENETDRLHEVDKIVNWTNPGPGGFYDDLGTVGTRSHVVNESVYAEDPSFYRTSFVGFSPGDKVRNRRISWQRYMQTIHGHPLKMFYPRIDPTASYEIRVTYAGDGIRLVAEGIQIHDYTSSGGVVQTQQFPVPAKAIEDGRLSLEFSTKPGKGGSGRGCQVAEVWLIKKK